MCMDACLFFRYIYSTKDECFSVFVCVQVDELYEAFCIQSRLRDGASRMKQAFSSSPSTKGTKESIAEVNRRYKEYTEVMTEHQQQWAFT